MTWYNIVKTEIKTASLRKLAFGEWWIDEDGRAEFADGDAGIDVMNHAMVVQSRLWGEKGMELAQFDNDPESFVQYGMQYLNCLCQKNGVDPQTLEDPRQFIEYDCSHAELLECMGYSPEAALVMTGSFVNGKQSDPREYGMKYYGLKRATSYGVETWTLTTKDMMAIARGWEEIAEQNGDDDYEADLIIPKIWVGSSGAMFSDVPVSALRTGKPQALSPYNPMRQRFKA